MTLPGRTFETSRKIPEEVFATGQQRIVADLLDGDLANVHMGTVALGIRHVLCTPLRLVRYVDTGRSRAPTSGASACCISTAASGERCCRRRRAAALETLATEAAVAIENARLYRETLEKARIEQEMRIAAEIQQALLPQAVGTPARSSTRRRIACRAARSAATSSTTSTCPADVRLRAGRCRRQRTAGGAADRGDAGHVLGAGRVGPIGRRRRSPASTRR